MATLPKSHSHSHGSSPSAFSTPASTSLFRRLTWEGTVPLEIHIGSKELPANSDRGLESYYIQAPRVSYLPLLIPEIKKFLTDLVLDDAGNMSVKEMDWWFEGEDGHPIKWHWPIGLLYDCHTVSLTSASTSQAVPLRMTLHLASPPVDKLLLSPSQESCKQAFMGQLKEADFLRWGNTKRVTGLRKAEQDGIWEGIKDHNFDNYWRVASKICPTATPSTTPSPQPLSALSTLQPRSNPNNDSPSSNTITPDSAYAVRSVPLRIYLPDGPVLQDLVPPVDEGRPALLGALLSSHLPLLFPLDAPPLAYVIVQGVVCSLQAEVAWLGACLAGADGWVNVCVGLGTKE
ncbi:autophagy protein 5 [Hysterangium stoloniferum]|nr:autophagy protein 5 [Hysterangium stoloniferum]